MNASTSLVPVFTGTLQDQSVQLCNARDLHAFLEVGRDFSTWLKERIEQYGFTEGEDFVFGSPKRGNQTGRGGDRRSRDYHLTLDMAKELAMVENNDKGRQVRRYFIALERQAHTAPALPATITPEQQNALQQMVAKRAGESGGIRAYMWSRFNNHFALGSYKQLPATRFDEAVAYLESMPMKGDAPALPAPTDTPTDEEALAAKLIERGLFTCIFTKFGPTLRAVPDDSIVASPAQFVRMVADPLGFPRHLLLPLIQAAAKRLESLQ
jgi:phage anti-repressor protein